MSRWRITGNYGTFEITQVVEAVTRDDAYEWTGIRTTLETFGGWEFLGDIEGEEWEIVQLDDDGNPIPETAWSPEE